MDLRSAALAAVFGLAVPAAAQDVPASPKPEGRFAVSISGSFAPLSSDFAGDRTFTEFAEQGSLRSAYSNGTGPGLEVGLQYRFGSRLGVGLFGSAGSRKTTAGFDASLPHPLYFNRARQVSGSVDDLDSSEVAGHLDLMWIGGSDRFDVTLFAGPSVYRVSQELVESVRYDHTYPYDTATVVGANRRSFSRSLVGFNLGGSLGYRVTPKVSLGALARYGRASGEVGDADVNAEVDAGGLTVGVGARVRF